MSASEITKRRNTVRAAHAALLDRYGTVDPWQLGRVGATDTEIGAARNLPALFAAIERDVAPDDVVEAAVAARDEHVLADRTTCQCGYPPEDTADWDRHRMRAALATVLPDGCAADCGPREWRALDARRDASGETRSFVLNNPEARFTSEAEISRQEDDRG